MVPCRIRVFKQSIGPKRWSTRRGNRQFLKFCDIDKTRSIKSTFRNNMEQEGSVESLDSGGIGR